MADQRPKQRTQFDALTAAYDRFCAELTKYSDPNADALAQSWHRARTQYAEWLHQPGSKVTRSKLASGMKQGLRDMRLMLQACSKEVREPLLSSFRRIVEEEVPGFFSFESQRVARILVRGRLRNEDEWDLVRHRVDEIEGDEAQKEELTRLYQLLDGYEKRLT